MDIEDRKILIRVASTLPQGDSLRRAVIAGLIRLAEEDGESASGKGPGKDFIEYMKQVWDGGKKKVSNPNPKTRDAHPEVAVSTAMKDKKSSTYKQVMDGFKKWTEEKKKGGDTATEDNKPAAKKPDAKKVLKSVMSQVLGSRSPHNRGVYERGAYGVDTTWEKTTSTLQKKMGVPFPAGKQVPLKKYLPDEMGAYEKSIQSFKDVLRTKKDDADALQSAFDEVKSTQKKLLDAASQVEIPESDVAEYKKIQSKNPFAKK